MKKSVIILCSILLLIVALGFALVTWKSFSMRRDLSRHLVYAKKVYQQLERDYPFAADQETKIDGLRFEEWLKIAQEMRDAKNKKIVNPTYTWARVAGQDFSYLFHDFSGFHRLLTGPVAIFERHRMSLGEFDWITIQLMGTLGSEEILQHPTLAKIGRRVLPLPGYFRSPASVATKGVNAHMGVSTGEIQTTITLTELIAKQNPKAGAEMRDEQLAHMLRIIEVYRDKLELLLDYLATGDLLFNIKMAESAASSDRR